MNFPVPIGQRRQVSASKTLPVGDNDVTRTCYPDVVVPLVLLGVTQCTMSSLYISITCPCNIRRFFRRENKYFQMKNCISPNVY